MANNGYRYAVVELFGNAALYGVSKRSSCRIVPAFLPFNLLKGGLNASITFLLYKPIVTALRKSGYVATLENEARQKHTGLLILASFIIVTCVLIILSMNRII